MQRPSHWLPDSTEARYEAVARLYLFCRYMDDLADADPAGCNHEKLVALRADFVAGRSADRLCKMYLSSSQYEIPLSSWTSLMRSLPINGRVAYKPSQSGSVTAWRLQLA